MSTKLAACDPCRFAKVACDHVRPVCGRCQIKGPSTNCEYRAQPFKKQKTISRSVPRPAPLGRERSANQHLGAHQTSSTTDTHQYPNPGYLGSSSHTTIFQNLSPIAEDETSARVSSGNIDNTPALVVDDDQTLQARKLIEDIRRSANIESCVALVDYWTNHSGINLPSAASFVTTCARSIESLFTSHDASGDAVGNMVRDIFHNYCEPFAIDQHSTMDDFIANFNASNIRWETIGLFFTAVSRASIDVLELPPHFTSAQQFQSLRRLALQYADRCLDIALSLDCLNDVQLVFQYENFINHSFVDGDQSYHSWKRLGDVISSIFALGYHEKINANGLCPEFLIHLRQSVVARAYSADKNVSIFLGRPPRMIRKYCTFDFLDVCSSQINGNYAVPVHYLGWTSDKDFDYSLETWWSFICAILKEEVLELSSQTIDGERLRKACAIKNKAQARWITLPSRYRYSGDLRLHHYKPIERDFIASARLNYLHVLFMVHRACTQNNVHTNPELLSTCAEILQLTAKAAIMKERLTNSGTGLIWKICHYGLPAAGILCLSLLQSTPSSRLTVLPRSRVLQDLSVLVAQVDSGILIDPSDPDYALLTAATRAIQTILDKVLTPDVPRGPPGQQQCEVADPHMNGTDEDWLHWPSYENLDFEVDFWTTLIEHPVLATGN